MAAVFLAKRGVINIYRASPRDYNNGVRFVGRVTSSRYFAHRNDERASPSSESMHEARRAAMGTTTDGKAPNVPLSHAVDTAKKGMRNAIDIANEESGDDAAERESEEDAAETPLAGGEEEEDGDVAVGETGAVRGQNQSSG